ncbi:FAD-dependent oxidoreductase [Haloarculaceae archaeon H-GB2-1]|nr:FAD-dependent oxidoreductase [Haloarculaceae archaeon H-GB1-1]MEA5386415.1 FAD-dependent oxidoreductase [Haloarculaceae archaeon H-GB11]MEA5407925.1 FAD-dependent oxidoreductase [Haloarculaceae archaeon H-GB2-1]
MSTFTSNDRYDVVIVGAGVTGCASAWRLAADHDVAVIEKGQVAGEASGLAAGLISPSKFYPERPQVSHHINEFYREFDGTGEFEFHDRARVGLIHPDLEAEARERAEFLSSHDLPTTFLQPEQVAERYPRLSTDGFAGAVEYADHGWVDPYTLTTTFQQQAQDRGADFFTNMEVDGLVVEQDRVTGVETETGELRGDHVVLATGWRTPHIVEEWIGLPIKPFKLQILTLDHDWADGWQDDFPITHIEHEGMYVRPEQNGRLLVGDGFREVDHPETQSSGVDADEQFHRDAARNVPAMVPDLGKTEVVNDWAGIEGMVPDVQPVVDAPDATPDGLVIAQASTLGILSAPALSTAVRSLVTGEDCPFPLDPFSADRFDIRTPDWGQDELPAYFEEEL